jgi:site-specific recombinase XerD
MSNCKLNVVREIERTLAGRLDQEQVTMVSEAVIKALANYDVTEMQTDIVPRESENERLLKQYCACLFVDGKSKHTIYQYRRACNRLAETIGKPFTEIGAYELRYFLACEKSRGVAASSVETYRAIFSAFFQWLANEEIIPKNPCANIKPGKINDAVRLPFSDVEIDALRSACETDKERALVELLLSSGIRVSEFSGLEISDIDPHKMTVHVRHGKGDKARVTYLTNVALKYLTAYWKNRKEDGVNAFYNGKHQPLGVCGVRYILNEIAKRAKVTNVHPHRFRRTFASGLAARGMDVQDIQRLLGHTNINTTMRYVYISSEKIESSYKQHIA